MTEMTQERQAPGTGSSEPTTGAGQASEKTQELVQRAQQTRGQAADRMRQEVDNRSTQAGQQVTAAADALRRVSGQLREEGNDGQAAQVAGRAAQPLDRMGRYLTEADADRILRDAEQFARRRPWVAVAGGAVLGLVVARFLKASNDQDGMAQQRDPYAAALQPGQTQTDQFDGQPAQ